MTLYLFWFCGKLEKYYILHKNKSNLIIEKKIPNGKIEDGILYQLVGKFILFISERNLDNFLGG